MAQGLPGLDGFRAISAEVDPELHLRILGGGRGERRGAGPRHTQDALCSACTADGKLKGLDPVTGDFDISELPRDVAICLASALGNVAPPAAPEALGASGVLIGRCRLKLYGSPESSIVAL